MDQLSRREEYAEATRRALVDSAREVFTDLGYAGASIEAIVRRARVTRGALYHHFKDKQQLFEVVAQELVQEVSARVAAASAVETDPWQRVESSLAALLEAAQSPAYQRIILEDWVSVLGTKRAREIDDRTIVRDLVATLQGLVAAGLNPVHANELTAHILLGAVTEAAVAIGASPDPGRAASAARGVLMRFLRSLSNEGR